ncbi:tRNA(Ile)-lysidine synthase [Methylomonas lenta]|uniref:tRNA(Ile)-lysidine synthase n=1 Tax=Methylomonas lenta TaxID=980561 RepID=A0A177NS33_9GAMM|nr:tRNA lysidine(34) synthetase TilS [Methylomonas lenta]OAI20897.1 tRNA(Ile)-lysidine synthase [Methylomonas lenta]
MPPSLSYQAIASQIPACSGNIYIAYSGGIDSHVLLHLVASQANLKPKIIAVYVNHGLQALADDWGAHCRRQAENLGVSFVGLKVDAQAANGESPEAAARNARYQALQGLIQTDDCLLLAQHREDQMETLLLQLFRGAGVQGLAGMPASLPFGEGSLLRPLLNIAKADIREYGLRHGLDWVEDPSNQSNDFDRNYLRNEVVPILKQRWPALDKTIARSAQNCGEAVSLLDDWGQQMITQLVRPLDNSLAIDQLKAFSVPQSNWLIRQWFGLFGLKPPSQALLQAIKQQFVDAGPNAHPQILTQGHVLKKYRQRLYCLTEQHCIKPTDRLAWPNETPTLTLANGYRLSRVSASSGINQQLWHTANISIRPRSGGEKIKLPGREGQHSLKKLFQEVGIPPWERETRPLIYLDDRLAAVAGLWIAEWAYACNPDACYRLNWVQFELSRI